MECIPTRKVVKKCDCRKPSLYICHGNSSFKKHSDGRNINYHFSLISAACSHSKLAESRLPLMQLDRPSSFISLVIMGNFWLLLLKCPRYPLLYWGNTRNDVERRKQGWKRLSPQSGHSPHFLWGQQQPWCIFHLHICLFLYILAEAHSIRKERDFFGHLLKTKQCRPNSGILLLEAFCLTHTRKSLTLKALLGSKKA